MAKDMTSGSDSAQRQDYKKTSAPKPAAAKKQTINTMSKMGKGLNSRAPSILGMGRGAK